MIHDRICESRKTNSIDFYSEVVWVRLLTKADDNGNYYRDARRVHANCMLEKSKATEEDTEKALKALLKIGLLREYEADDRKYVHLADFHDWQRIRSDRGAKIDHPVHPPKFGGAYVPEGDDKGIWINQFQREAEASQEPSGNQADTSGKPVVSQEETGGTPVVALKDKVKVKDKVKESEPETEPTELTSGDLKTFKTIFRDETGAKAKLGRKSGEMLMELCARHGLTAVLEAIPKWVEDEGGKAAIQNDKRKREWACANFLRDAEEIIEAMKSGAFEPEKESEAPRFGAAPLPPEMMR